MLTEFGKLCRKIRIDSNELLGDMAAKLNVSASFLSAVENGKKNVPDGWVTVIAREYSLTKQEQCNLETAVMKSAKQVKIQTGQLNNDDKDFVLAFARNFDKLDRKDRDAILKLLRK